MTRSLSVITRRRSKEWGSRIGGYAEATIKRVARFGDGWFPWRAPDDKMRATLERLREYTIAAGRDPTAIGLEPQLNVSRVPEAEWERYFDAWRGLGATHFCINTMGMRFTSAEQHIAMLRRVQEALGVGGR